MRLAPLSSDLVVKLSVGAGLVLALVLAARAAKNAAGDAAGAAWSATKDAAWGVSPFNQNNVIYGGVNKTLSDVLGREESLGGWFHDLITPDPMKAMAAPPVNPADVTGNGTGTGSYLDQFNQANSY